VSHTSIGARCHWALKRGRGLERWCDGIRLLDEWFPFRASEPRLRRAWKVCLVSFLARGIGVFRYQL